MKGRHSLWLLVAGLVSLSAHIFGVWISELVFGFMHVTSELALEAARHTQRYDFAFRALVFPAVALASYAYVQPIVRYSFSRTGEEIPAIVRRRTLGTPLVFALLGFSAWIVSTVFYPSVTFYNLGHWPAELLSEQVITPVATGFLSSTSCYLLVDWIVRSRLVPHVFPRGRVSGETSVWSLGVRSRLLVLVVAVGFTPLFTMMGLIQAAQLRVTFGLPLEEAFARLVDASGAMFLLFGVLGIAYTLLVAHSLAGPLARMARVLAKIEAGDLAVGVQVSSDDEVGVLAQGVNSMVATLREKEHILQTFGRVVEPSVRDRLLAGDIRAGGESRTVTALFVDLRGFTKLAESHAPREVIDTLNDFFSVMTDWVRDCGGFVDKFIGDALLAVFGLFDEQDRITVERNAAAACRCAVGMGERLEDMNERRAVAGLDTLAIAVTVHGGQVLAAAVGARDRHEYTVIGDAVNVAARLQELCKQRDADVLVSRDTMETARAAGFDAEVAWEQEVSVRGRSGSLRVCDLTARS